MKPRLATVMRAALEHFPNVRTDLVREAYNAVNYDDVKQKVSTSVTYAVWDGKSPINGVPADEVRRLHNMSAAQTAYMIYIDGALVIFQPRDPQTKAPITPETADSVARAHVERIVEERARGEFTQEVLDYIAQKM